MNDQNRTLIAVLVIVVLAVLAYGAMNMRDNRSTGERVGDAVDALPHGIGKAADQLGDRTPGEKLGDAVRETGDKIKDNTR